MQHLHENIKIEMARLKHSKRVAVMGFVFFAIISSIFIGIMFLKVVEEREANAREEKIINDLKYENTNLQKEIIEHKNQIEYLNRRIGILLTEQRSLYQQQQLEIEQRQQAKRYEQIQKPKQVESEPNTTFKPQEQSVSKVQPTQQNYNRNLPRYTPPAPIKMYPRYTVAKLVSDSRIERMQDNRLKSNMPIFGRYMDRPVVALECGKNERVHTIVNECTGTVFPLEQVYFRESNKKSIMNHDIKTHMVECAYNQEHGIMHDCSVKLIGVR